MHADGLFLDHEADVLLWLRMLYRYHDRRHTGVELCRIVIFVYGTRRMPNRAVDVSVGQ